MNVVVMIQGREAIPVRAIPLLTDWEVLSPDELAGALTGDYPHNPSFEKLTAHSSEDGHLKDVKPRWWSNFPVRQLEALSHRIKHKEISHDDGYEQWRRESLLVLPSGVFVWKDEFEACFWSAYGPDGEIEWAAVEGNFKRRKRKEFIELDFEPLVSAELLDLVMKGFEPQTTHSSAPESQTKPVGANSAFDGVEPNKAGPAKPLQRTTAQDSAILCEIEKQGYDPLALPKNLPGKAGVKAAVRAALSKNPLFTGGTVFDKAWERLTARADIAIQG